jgi:hypothetical protein
MRKGMLGVLVAVLGLVLVGPASRAQGGGDAGAREPTAEELAAARQVFNDGLDLEKKEQWADALAKFALVAKIKMTPQVRYHLARCHERLGRLVDALNGYELAAQEAKAMGDKARDVLENAPPRAAELRSRVAHVRIQVTGTVRSSRILLDGRAVSLALVDTLIPVDPGAHRIEVRRGADVTAERELQLAAAASETVALTIDDPVPSPPPTASTAPPPPPPPPPPPSRVPAYATAGAGAALLVGGGVLWGLREATIAAIRETCTGEDTGCDPAFEPTEELGRTYTTVSYVLFGVGGAAVATGVVLWLVLAPPEDTAASGARAPLVRVGLAPSPGGATLLGGF